MRKSAESHPDSLRIFKFCYSRFRDLRRRGTILFFRPRNHDRLHRFSDMLLAGLDQFPEMRVILQYLILTHIDIDAGAEEEILERIAAQNPVDQNTQIMLFKVNPVISQTEAVKGPALTLQAPETFIGLINLLRQAAEFTQDIQLQIPGHLGKLRGGHRSEYDLKWSHY